ncbi:hypothetical protein [Kutzneria sp. CA-103260]|uniref:hypothetical protein n=1 Tax=Kutzneria sp. CA-103260 TaxID=2802641 RepID=UPI001BA7E477|nr:hypothetical protein [Kutzneria sp. CA-103260]
MLIGEEAHRIRETSNNRYTPTAKHSDRPHFVELLDAARWLRTRLVRMGGLQTAPAGEWHTVPFAAAAQGKQTGGQ